MRKIMLIGSVLCPDTLLALCKLKEADAEVEFHNMTGTMQELKLYLALRDHEPLFEQVKAEGRVGIPFMQTEDGRKTFDWQEALAWARED